MFLYKKKKLIIVAIVLILTFLIDPVDGKSFQEHVRAGIRNYDLEINEDGIAVDLSDHPYYMTKQPKYYYRSPDEITYYSQVTGTWRHALVLLPGNFDEEKNYPVLYLLHGFGGSHRTWINKNADIIIQNLNYFYDVPEMIVVFPNSELNQEENTDDLPMDEAVLAYDLTERDLVSSLMPYINSHYPVKTGKENTAIAGNSMGGRNALYTAFTHQELFGYVGAFSSETVFGGEFSHEGNMEPLLDEFVIDSEKGDFEFIMLMVGREDDDCGSVTYDIHENMLKNKVDHLFYDVEGGHENRVWQNALFNFCRKIFTEES